MSDMTKDPPLGFSAEPKPNPWINNPLTINVLRCVKTVENSNFCKKNIFAIWKHMSLKIKERATLRTQETQVRLPSTTRIRQIFAIHRLSRHQSPKIRYFQNQTEAQGAKGLVTHSPSMRYAVQNLRKTHFYGKKPTFAFQNEISLKKRICLRNTRAYQTNLRSPKPAPAAVVFLHHFANLNEKSGGSAGNGCVGWKVAHKGPYDLRRFKLVMFPPYIPPQHLIYSYRSSQLNLFGKDGVW